MVGRAWGGEAAGDAVFVDVRDGGVVLGEQGEQDGRGPGGEVVEVACAEGTEDGGEEKGRQESSVREGG